MVSSVTQAVLSPSCLYRSRCYQHHRPQSRLGFLGAILMVSSLILTYSGRGGVDALSCSPCDPSLCPNTTDCQGGLVLDICGCCQVCARLEGQSCGGNWGILGKCDRNLQCFIRPVPGMPILGGEEGICKEIKEFHCNGTECPRAFEQKLCPPDSYLVNSRPRHGEVSSNSRDSQDSNSFHNLDGISESSKSYLVPEQTSYCTCNNSLCEIPVCASGYSLHLAQNATGLPGTCCDVYMCNKTVDCDSVICPPYEEKQCPPDSFRMSPIWTPDRCCELQQGCKCMPEKVCEPVWCPAGFQVQVISRASRVPGSCCDRFRCVNESGLTCTYNGKELRNGETWNIDKCKTCECRDGLNRCKDKSCKNLSCTWMEVPEGECCPVCKGCVSDSGILYKDSVEWKENDCTTCTCKDGHAQCQSAMCESPCRNPIHVPGQCCPVCPDEETKPSVPSVTPTLCPSLENCGLTCKHGLEQTPEGCFICRCKEEKCNINCQFGLKTDKDGNNLCECRGSEALCAPWEYEKCEKKCEYGFKRSRDGCIKCKCNKCPQFNCTKRCVHGHILNDEGCELCKCKEMPLPELIKSNSEPEEIEGRSCMSQYGSRHENGESWNDGCRMCYCHNGVEMCSLIACPAPYCSNPVFRVGDCCPTCPGLTVISPHGEKEKCQSALGNYYVEGETWQMDACSRCVCHGGTILCETPSCPPVECHHPVKHEGQCCATCRGEDLGRQTLSTHHHRCKSPTGIHYKHGEVWKATPCQSCVCRNGQIHCYNQMCPPVNCNRTVLKKGQCCPTCVETNKRRTCWYQGVTYESGEKWQGDNCTQCICSGGRTECFPVSCTRFKCSVMIKKKGECCPVCHDLSQLQSENRQGNGIYSDSRQNNNTDVPVSNSKIDGNVIGFTVLGVLLVILVVVVFVLVLCLMKRKDRTKCRPKSNNVDHQGQGHFLPKVSSKTDNNAKSLNLEQGKPYLQSLCSDKSKAERANNHYTELNFGDQSNETMAFLNNVKA